MVFLSSDPPTNPFSVSVAYLTVLQVTVDQLRDTLSVAEAACTTASNAQTADSAASATRPRPRPRPRDGARIASCIFISDAYQLICIIALRSRWNRIPKTGMLAGGQFSADVSVAKDRQRPRSGKDASR